MMDWLIRKDNAKRTNYVPARQQQQYKKQPDPHSAATVPHVGGQGSIPRQRDIFFHTFLEACSQGVTRW